MTGRSHQSPVERVPIFTAPAPLNGRNRDTSAEKWDTQKGEAGR